MKIYITTNETGLRCWDIAKERLKDGEFLTSNPDEATVVISIYEKHLFPETFLKGKRVYNFHHGVLPYYRGTGTHTWAIVNREELFGITLHEVDKGIDTGDIIAIHEFPIKEFDTAEMLVLKGNEITVELFEKFFRNLVENEYTKYPQEFKGRLYQRKDLEELKNLSRVVRAFQFNGKEPCFYDDARGMRHYLKYYD
jgi:methionyl-tRNA formyltransferase